MELHDQTAPVVKTVAVIVQIVLSSRHLPLLHSATSQIAGQAACVQFESFKSGRIDDGDLENSPPPFARRENAFSRFHFVPASIHRRRPPETPAIGRGAQEVSATEVPLNFQGGG